MSDHVEDQSMLKDTPSNFKSRIFPVPRVKMMWSGKAEDLLQHRYVQTQKLHWPLQGNYILFFLLKHIVHMSHMSHVHTSLSVMPKKLNCCIGPEKLAGIPALLGVAGFRSDGRSVHSCL